MVLRQSRAARADDIRRYHAQFGRIKLHIKLMGSFVAQCKRKRRSSAKVEAAKVSNKGRETVDFRGSGTLPCLPSRPLVMTPLKCKSK